ncbi:MAG: hypothetical protein EU530_08060 [Promethearchaeota archaeon]|nr:MAG: hypothetical protein EU530_08060 [Candidatus Lokiarchaeota archaeon]
MVRTRKNTPIPTEITASVINNIGNPYEDPSDAPKTTSSLSRKNSSAYVGLALHYKEIMFTADEKIIKKLPKVMKSSVVSLNQVEEVLK